MHSTILATAVAVWSLAATTATAYTCSTDEDYRVYKLYEAVARDPVCSPYVTSGISVKWSCDKTPDCTVLVQQLEEQLPDCQSSKDGTNYRAQLHDALYGTCKLCTLDQLRAFSAISDQVSQSAACSPYSSGSGGFSWPCTATGCTAMVKSVSKNVPSCNYAGDNLQARVLNDIEACTGTSVSTTRPPSNGGSGGNPSSPSSTSSSSSTSSPASTSSSSSSSSTSTSTATPSPSSEVAGDSQGDSSSAQSPSATPATTAEPKACTTAETNSVRALLGAAANSSSCAGSGTYVFQTSISISAPCTSTCFEQQVRPLATTVPDCYTDATFSYSTVRRKVQSEIDYCVGETTSSRTAYVTVTFSSASSGVSGGVSGGGTVASGAASLSTSAWATASGASVAVALALALPSMVLRD